MQWNKFLNKRHVKLFQKPLRLFRGKICARFFSDISLLLLRTNLIFLSLGINRAQHYYHHKIKKILQSPSLLYLSILSLHFAAFSLTAFNKKNITWYVGLIFSRNFFWFSLFWSFWEILGIRRPLLLFEHLTLLIWYSFTVIFH